MGAKIALLRCCFRKKKKLGYPIHDMVKNLEGKES
jgi:hypothetical protein